MLNRVGNVYLLLHLSNIFCILNTNCLIFNQVNYNKMDNQINKKSIVEQIWDMFYTQHKTVKQIARELALPQGLVTRIVNDYLCF